MTNLLQRGAAFLAGQIQQNASVAAYFVRGSNYVEVSVTLGQQMLRVVDPRGNSKIERTDRDFIVPGTQLTFDDGKTFVTPERGDYWVLDDAQLGLPSQLRQYNVMPYNGEPPWRYSDPYKTLIRCHAKYTGVYAPVLTPSSGYISGGLVAIAGINLQDAISVTFNGVPAKYAYYDAADDTLRTEYFPTSTTGPVNVVIAYRGGIAPTTSTFTFMSLASIVGTQVVNNFSTVMPNLYGLFMGWDGNIYWGNEKMSDAGPGGSLWQLTQPGNAVTNFPLPDGYSSVTNLIFSFCAGPDGLVYGVDQGVGIVWQLNPADQAYQSFALPGGNVSESGTFYAGGICVGPDSSLWITGTDLVAGSVLWKISLATGTVSVFSIPNYSLILIIPNKNGNLYAVGSEFPLSETATWPLLEITTQGAVVSATPIPTLIAPTCIRDGCDGNLYISDRSYVSNNQAVVIASPANIAGATRYVIACDVPWNLSAMGDGNMWGVASFNTFTPDQDGFFFRITTAGTVTKFVVPGSADGIAGFVRGIVTAASGLPVIGVCHYADGAPGYFVEVTE